jgi:hypothetical protein
MGSLEKEKWVKIAVTLFFAGSFFFMLYLLITDFLKIYPFP